VNNIKLQISNTSILYFLSYGFAIHEHIATLRFYLKPQRGFFLDRNRNYRS